MLMRMRSSAAYLALFIGLSVTLAGCGYVSEIRAMKAFKDGNKAYASSDWRVAVNKYEAAAALAQSQPDCQWCPAIWFYLGNSYDNLYRPARKGEPANDALLQKAVDNYTVASEKLTEETVPKRSLALEFLVATYGPDKLADPTQAEPVVQRMIQLAPNEPTNYFQLAKIYEDSGEYQLAEETYLKGRDAKPSDPMVYLTVAGYYNRQGDFDKLIQNIRKNIELEPNNPEAHYRLATYSWDKASRDFRLTDSQKREIILDGLNSVDKALSLNPDYIEAMTYKGLLLRTQALIEKDPKKQQDLIREGTALGDKANAMRKARQG
ncbi:MAG: tetratricopeptide repeat protein [Acidimicrobiia bacterium]|nr:tetratricopeptide repeat protein [Acidimicrobiia bacterium]